MNVFTYLPILLVLALLLMSAIKILREYERGVVFQLGRFWKVKGPGLIILIPVIQQMVRVDLRTIVMDVPSQDLISRDNVSVQVNAVVYFRVVDPEKAIINVEHYYEAVSQLAQTTLRSVLGQHDLDEMLAEREKLNDDIRAILDAQTDAWGVKVANVEIKHVDINEVMVRAIARQAEAEREKLNDDIRAILDAQTDAWGVKVANVEIKHVDINEVMVRAIARQAEAERVRRAKVIHAEGELQAAEKLVDAAKLLGADPRAIQLRYMQTLTEIAGEKTSTIIFPLPLDLVEPMLKRLKGGDGDR
jgi:regulator of protease activity HflC (stomatin/prohibitin superfamily)